jgi:hypothetical protein
LCSSSKTSSRSGQAEHSPEKRVIRPGTSSAVSLTMPGQGCPRPPAGSTRIWLQQRYYSEQCRSHPPPRHGISRENSKISWRMPRSDGPKALPPEGKGAPQSIAQPLPDSCGRPRSTTGARGTRHLQPWVASTTSTTAATVEPASMRRCAEATTPGVGDATTTRRIGAPSPEPPGPQAFSRAIRRAPFPTRFQAPTTITKYSGETRPKLWLADYRLACQLGGTDDGNLIICNLPLFLSDAARAWLEHLPPAQISNWDDLVKAFAGKFQGTYMRLGNSWISEVAASSQGNPCESTSGGFRSSAPSCPTSPTWISSGCSSPAPLATTW